MMTIAGKRAPRFTSPSAMKATSAPDAATMIVPARAGRFSCWRACPTWLCQQPQ
jgi:hypothetical protein